MKRALLCLLLILLATLPCLGQTLQQIDRLITDGKLAEARSELSEMMKSRPDDHEVVRRYGIVLIILSNLEEDPGQSKELSKQGRAALLRAHQLGDRDPLLVEMLQQIPEAGAEKGTFSENAAAQQAMTAAEQAFAARRLEEAIAQYQIAAALDPKLYEAPLYLGDAYFQLGDTARACQAFEKATRINPDAETAYRYWGDALLKAGDTAGALRCYANAVVADPTSQLAWQRGLARGAGAVGGRMQVPRIVQQADLQEDGKTILVNSAAPAEEAAPWLGYAAVRAIWREKTFAERYPGQSYRRTLAEEAEALTSAATIAEELESSGKLEPNQDLELLIKLKRDGMMEPFALFAMGTTEPGRDYIDYRREHRDELVRFLCTYVVTAP
jgi:tetratricopeptide (TPR) repeat protein